MEPPAELPPWLAELPPWVPELPDVFTWLGPPPPFAMTGLPLNPNATETAMSKKPFEMAVITVCSFCS
jgi:hypothetical protein